MKKKKWHSSDFRRATKRELYEESTAPTRRRWIQKTLGGLLIFWLLSQAITPWTGLHNWERALPEFESKLADEKLQDANAWIFGSSTVLHHVIPHQLDSATKAHHLKWYNFGIQRSAPPESFYLAHELIDSPEANELKVLVFELQPEELLAWEDVSNLRNTAQLNLIESQRRIRCLPWQAPNKLNQNLEQSRILAWGWVQHVVAFLRPAKHMQNRVKPMNRLSEKGFIELKESDWITGRLAASHSKWTNNKDSLIDHQVFIAQDFDYRKTLPDPTINWDCDGRVKPILDQMEILLNKCEKNGVQCIFHFQNLWDTNGCIYYSAIEKWGSDHVFESMGYDGNEALYDKGDRYDETHLLRSGAKKFTKIFGESLNLMLNDTNKKED
jgi:hypothetical protein